MLEQIVALLAKDFDVIVFQLYQINSNYQADGFSLYGFKNKFKALQYLKFFNSFLRENRKKKFDAVHGFWIWPCGFLAVCLGKALHIKSVVSVLGGDGSSVPEINYGYLHRTFYRKIILWSITQADEANALTNYLADNLKRAGLNRKLKIIPWGVDPELFRWQEHSIQTPIRFLHVANFNLVKDQTTLLKAFAIIGKTRECHLTIIGEGSEEKNLRQMIRELDIEKSVRLLERVPYRELARHYHNSDILLHTSLSEGQSEVVTEAMSCGLLVCGTKVGLLYDLPEGCVSVPVQACDLLAKELIEILSAREKLNQIQSAARQWSLVHSIQWTVSELANLY